MEKIAIGDTIKITFKFDVDPIEIETQEGAEITQKLFDTPKQKGVSEIVRGFAYAIEMIEAGKSVTFDGGVDFDYALQKFYLLLQKHYGKGETRQ